MNKFSILSIKNYKVKLIFTDIDETVTTDGVLISEENLSVDALTSVRLASFRMSLSGC